MPTQAWPIGMEDPSFGTFFRKVFERTLRPEGGVRYGGAYPGG